MMPCMQINYIDAWGPTFTCPTMEHIGVIGDGGKWVCGVNEFLQRCAPPFPPVLIEVCSGCVIMLTHIPVGSVLVPGLVP